MAPWCVERVADDLTVMDLPTCYDEVQRPALAVVDGADFRRASAAAIRRLSNQIA
jgi:hypothetical protein